MPVEPGEGPFNNPSLGKDNESLCLDRTQHGLQDDFAGFLGPRWQTAFAIRAVTEDDFESSIRFANAMENEVSAFVVLEAGRVNNNNQQQTERVNGDVSFATSDLLSAVKPAGFSAFSRPHGLSMIAAVGVGFFPAAFRTCSRSRS